PTENFKDQLANILTEFGLEPKGRARAYQKPYPKYFDTTPYPRGLRIPDFVKFTGEDGRSTFEHVGQFLAQCSEVSTSDICRVEFFPLSLSGTAFTWFTSLAPNSIATW
uniref:Retrotransposon gag domain-containing protein n=1 Tax=Triticum urartu TaxID=4572 RepID=A0A8R7QP39_TRIUA